MVENTNASAYGIVQKATSQIGYSGKIARASIKIPLVWWPRYWTRETTDEIILNNNSGFEVSISGTEKDRSKLELKTPNFTHLFCFKNIPIGKYKVVLKVGGAEVQSFTLTESLKVEPEGCEIEGGDGTKGSSQPKGASERTERERDRFQTQFLKLVRLRCDHDRLCNCGGKISLYDSGTIGCPSCKICAHCGAPLVETRSAKNPKPIVNCTRCNEKGLKEAWLKDRYIILSPEGKDEFTLFKTDDQGFLCFIEGDEVHRDKTLKLFDVPGKKYEIYLSLFRWWGASKEADEKILKEAKNWKGKEEKKALLLKEPRSEGQFLTFDVTEKEVKYLPLGSQLYNDLTLFYDMPNECKMVRDQIARLQYHLGLLHYPIASEHTDLTKGSQDAALNPYVPTLAQEGYLELMTYNGIIAFQRDSGYVGKGEKPNESKVIILDKKYDGMIDSNKNPKYEFYFGVTKDPHKKTFRWLNNRYAYTYNIDWYKKSWSFVNLSYDEIIPVNFTEYDLDPPRWKKLIKIEEKVVGLKKVKPNVKNYSCSKNEIDDFLSKKDDKIHIGIVDKATGDLIKSWLDQGYRKPGHILLPITDGFDYVCHTCGRYYGPKKDVCDDDKTRLMTPTYVWLREDAALRLSIWRALGEYFGSIHGIRLCATFRSVAKDIVSAGEGSIRLSIHKSALALDLWTGSEREKTAYLGDPKRYPIIYEQEITSKNTWNILDKTRFNGAEIRKKVDYLNSHISQELKSSELLSFDSKGENKESAYRTNVRQWQYDPTHEGGGKKQTTPSGGDYISLTALGALRIVELTRLGAHEKGWQLNEEVCSLDPTVLNENPNPKKKRYYNGFEKLFYILKMAVSNDSKEFVKIRNKNELSKKVGELEPIISEWYDRMKQFHPTPDVEVNNDAIRKGVVSEFEGENKNKWKYVDQIILMGKDKKILDIYNHRDSKTQLDHANLTDIRPVLFHLEEWKKRMTQWVDTKDPNGNIVVNEGNKISILQKINSEVWPLGFEVELGYSDGRIVKYVPPWNLDFAYVRPRLLYQNKLELVEGDEIKVSWPGKPVHMEWWHFQHNNELLDGKKFKKNAQIWSDIGFTHDAMVSSEMDREELSYEWKAKDMKSGVKPHMMIDVYVPNSQIPEIGGDGEYVLVPNKDYVIKGKTIKINWPFPSIKRKSKADKRSDRINLTIVYSKGLGYSEIDWSKSVAATEPEKADQSTQAQ